MRHSLKGKETPKNGYVYTHTKSMTPLKRSISQVYNNGKAVRNSLRSCSNIKWYPEGLWTHNVLHLFPNLFRIDFIERYMFWLHEELTLYGLCRVPDSEMSLPFDYSIRGFKISTTVFYTLRSSLYLLKYCLQYSPWYSKYKSNQGKRRVQGVPLRPYPSPPTTCTWPKHSVDSWRRESLWF